MRYGFLLGWLMTGWTTAVLAQVPGKDGPPPPALATLGGSEPGTKVFWDSAPGRGHPTTVDKSPSADQPVTVAGDPACSACLPCCTPCGPKGRFWISAEFLIWWVKGDQLPPLVTMSASPAGQGVLGGPDTAVLFGGSSINDGPRYGFRVSAGAWLDDCHRWGIEGGFFALSRPQDGFLADGRSGATLGRPFFNVATQQPDAQLVSLPGVLSGTVAVGSFSELYGADLNLRRQLSCCEDCCGGLRIDLLAGFRYLQLEEELVIRENLESIDPNGDVPVGTRLLVEDRFRTRNEFYGGQIGAVAECWRDRWFVNIRGLLGLGVNRQTVEISGTTTILVPGFPAETRPGGLLAQSTNSGTFSRSEFAVVPEISVSLGYQVTEHLRVYAGYSLLWWTNVVRPGDVIDVAVNPTQIPPGTLIGPARPAFTWRTSDIWIHGLHLGAQVRF